MSPAPLINTDSLNQWLAGRAQGTGCSTPTKPRCSQSSPQSESQVVGCKVAVCSDRLWVIEALTRRSWGGESGGGDCRLFWCLEKAHGFHWEMTAVRFQESFEKKTFITLSQSCLIKRQEEDRKTERLVAVRVIVSCVEDEEGKGHGKTLILVHAA